ncbi:MAG: lipid II:glycine glycyltransferase FemX [Aggregatilineales bacterium]
MTVINPPAEQWNQFVNRHPHAHVLQLAGWADLKTAYGWQSARVGITDADGTIIAGAQLLFRVLPMRLGAMAYLPCGAYVTDEAQWTRLWDAIHACAKKHGAAFLKWEPGFYLDDAMPDFTQWDFVESPQTIQPPSTIMLNIADDDDAIMKRMNQGTRRKIRKSLKNDIYYTEASADDVQKFTQMMQTTGDRNDFGVHHPAYYEDAYRLLVPENAALILAEYENDVLAGLFVTATGGTAQYLYGASSNIKRKLMASYGVQWQAIQWAKARGCTYYDMWGIPDESAEILEAEFKDRNDGMWGVYGFKRGFGGEVVRSAGAWDFVYNRLIYAAYRTALKMRG